MVQLSLAILLITVLAVFVPQVSGDFMTDMEPLYIRINPPQGSIVKSNPPSFWWSTYGFLGRYTFTLSIWSIGANGTTQNWNYTTTNSFYNVPIALPVGTNYTWRVTVISATNTTRAVSDARSFYIDPASTTFIVNPNLVAETTNSARPRLLMKGDAKAAYLASPAGQAFVQRLNSKIHTYLNQNLGGALPETPNKTINDFPPDSPEWSQYTYYVMNVYTSPQTLYISNAIFALWYNMSNTAYVSELKRRTLALAAADPLGATSNAAQDQANRAILLSLTQSLDLLYDRFNATERSNIIASVKNRTEQVYNGGKFINSLMIGPYQSHEASILGFIATATVGLLGELPEATEWAVATIPMFFNMYSTWGLQEGGFANGMGYNYIEANSAPSRYKFLKWGTGVDLYQKQWVREWPLQFIYFAPPGAASGGLGFGDAGPDDNRLYQSVSCLVITGPILDQEPNSPLAPLYDWYCNALDYSIVDYRQFDSIWGRSFNTPHDLTGNFPKAIHMTSIGWAAFHSSLPDKNRTSLFFRASKFGAYNHNHPDQLCFTFAHKGKPLLINSGYYDYYVSPHHAGWTRTTRAKSGGVTMDGGIGQTNNIQNLDASGEITQFGTSDEYDYITGNALAAYNWKVAAPLQLTRAIRSIVYLRKSNQFLILDQFDANSTARGFEWNIHAYRNFSVVSASTVKSFDGSAELCIKMLYAPANYTFWQTDQFTVPVAGKAQAHGQFKLSNNLTSVTFVVLLDPDCTGVEPQLHHSRADWSFEVTEGTNAVWNGNQLAFVPRSSASTSASVPTSTSSAPAPTSGRTTSGYSASSLCAASHCLFSVLAILLIGLL